MQSEILHSSNIMDHVGVQPALPTSETIHRYEVKRSTPITTRPQQNGILNLNIDLQDSLCITTVKLYVGGCFRKDFVSSV